MSYIFLFAVAMMVFYSDASIDSKLIACAIMFAAYRTEETLRDIKKVLKAFRNVFIESEESEEDE